MAQSPIENAISQICQEKGLSEEAVLGTIESALAAAYRKDFGNKMQNIIAEFNPKTGGVKVFDVKTVVEDLPEEEAEIFEEEKTEPEIKKTEGGASLAVGEETEVKKFNPKTEIQLKDAKEINKKYKVGDQIITPLEVPGEFGRMAAQTAKQVIIQKIREEERQNIYEEYKNLTRQVIIGTIQRREGRNFLVDLGRTVALLPLEEQVRQENYHIGNRMKFYLKSVEQSTRGPQLIVSRAVPELVEKIFEMEIPEVANGVVEIKKVARESGGRSKVAIISNDESVDPIGACVGQRGTRIQTIINELGNEKIDIILWSEDSVKFITNALSPAKVVLVKLQEPEEVEQPESETKEAETDELEAEANKEADKSQIEEEVEAGGEVEQPAIQKTALVTVKEDQLSLAIGKGGQNVRLASRLTGWKIDIVSDTGRKPEEIFSQDEDQVKSSESGEADSQEVEAGEIQAGEDEKDEKTEAEENKKESKTEAEEK